MQHEQPVHGDDAAVLEVNLSFKKFRERVDRSLKVEPAWFRRRLIVCRSMLDDHPNHVMHKVSTLLVDMIFNELGQVCVCLSGYDSDR